MSEEEDVPYLCDERRDMKKRQYEAEGAKVCREANKGIQKVVKKAEEDWIGIQEIKTCLNKNNSKRAYQLVTDLTSEKQGGSTNIQDKSGKDLIQKNTRFSAGGQNIAHNYTTTRAMVTMQFWIAVSPQKKICNRFLERKLRLQ